MLKHAGPGGSPCFGPVPAKRVPLYRWGLAALLVAVLLLNLLTLLNSPPPYVDEAWRAARAYGLIRNGQAFGTLDAGVFDRYPGYWTFFPFLETWFLTPAIRLLGLGLFAVRLVSLLFGLALLVALYVIIERLYDPRLGLLSVAIVALSKSFIYSAHLARQDIMVAAFGFGAIALYLADRGSRLTLLSVLSGLAVGLAFEIHPNGMIYGPVVVALLLLDYGRRVWRAPRAWGFCLGAAAGLVFYAALHILPYPQTYRALTQMGYSSTHTPPFLVPDPRLWLEGLLKTWRFIYYVNRTHALLGVAAAAVLLQRRSRADWRLLAIMGVLYLAVSELIRNKQYHYGILINPALDLLLAVALARGAEALWGAYRRRKWLLVAPLGAGLAVGLALLVAPFVRNVEPLFDRSALADYDRAAAAIREAVPPEATVLGTQTYWFAVPDQRYLSWEQLVYYRRYAPAATFDDALREFKPDYIIADGHLRSFLVEETGPLSGYRGSLALPKGEWERFLAQQGRLIQVIPTQTGDKIEIYHINWP